MAAQHGEDVWLAAHFARQSGGYAADVGASDGVSISNTYGLEVNGWEVLCVEPNPVFHHSLCHSRKLVTLCAAGASDAMDQEFTICGPAGGFAAGSALTVSDRLVATVDGLKEFGKVRVPVYRLDRLLEEAKFPRCDVVSIDTEGTEADVLRGFDPARWGTKVVIVENNFAEEETREIMRGHQFVLTERLGVNDIWVKE